VQHYVVFEDMYQYESIGRAPKKHEKSSTIKIPIVVCCKVVIRLFVYFFFRRGVTVFPSFFYKLEPQLFSLGSKDEKMCISLSPNPRLE
jgi:hypothetical protein